MPYTLENLPDNVKALPAKQQRQWRDIFNSSFARCQKGGKDEKECEAFSFRNANGVVKVGQVHNSASFSDASGPQVESVATFDLEQIVPAPLFDDGNFVYRRGKLFEIGNFVDKQFQLDKSELLAAVEAFTAPVPVDMEHIESPLSGKLGELVSVEASDDGTELHGIVALPKWLDNVLDERKVSTTWLRDKKILTGLALVRNPRVSDAALMAAFSAAGGDCGCDDPFSQFSEIATKEQYQALSTAEKFAIYDALIDRGMLSC